VLTNEATASATPVDLTTVGPQITLSRAGEYNFAWGAELYNSAAGNGSVVHLMLGAGDWDIAVVVHAAGANYWQRASRMEFGSGVTASTVVKLQYSAQGGTSNFRSRDLQIIPVRVS
jgi:hypothetical protein